MGVNHCMYVQLEGVAYRGRLLVEVESTVGKYPDSAKPMPIEKTDVDRVEVRTVGC